MPHLFIRGMEVNQVKEMSTSLVEELAEICECETDNFMLEVLHTTSVFNGEIVPSYPFIEVAWFERGQLVRDRFAECVTKHVLATGIEEIEVAFRTFVENEYYINGKSCE
jgi:phenylpyruvate tautomerase PptA (4-oxalocrotonate tautomerase family)